MKSLVLLVPGLFDAPSSMIDHQTPLMKAQTPFLDQWAAAGEWLKVSAPKQGAKQVWAELLGLSSERVNLSESALEIYAAHLEFKPNQCSFLFQFRSKIGEQQAEYDPNLLKEGELTYLCEELNRHFAHLAFWKATQNSQGLCILNEPLTFDQQTFDQGDKEHPFFQTPRWQKALGEVNAFLHHHPFNELRIDFEEPLCNSLYFYAPGGPLSVVASSGFYQHFALFSSDSCAKGLSHLLGVEHHTIEKKQDLSHLDHLLIEIEETLASKQHLIVECSDLLDHLWGHSVLEKIKRIEYLDRSFFSKIAQLASQYSLQLLISPMYYSKAALFSQVPWLRVHPRKKPFVSSVFSFKEAVLDEISMTHTLYHLAQQFLRV